MSYLGSWEGRVVAEDVSVDAAVVVVSAVVGVVSAAAAAVVGSVDDILVVVVVGCVWGRWRIGLD